MAFPATYNFNYYRGDYYSFVIRPKTSNGLQFNLDNFVYNESTNPNNATFKIASSRGSVGFASQRTCTVDVDATTGIITCVIPPSVGTTLTPGTWVYDVEITNPTDSVVYTLLTGTITVTDQISGATSL